MVVVSTLFGAPVAHLSAKSTDILYVSAISRHSADAELTNLRTLMAALRTVVVARLTRHALDALLASQDAFLTSLDASEVGVVQLCHERDSPSPLAISIHSFVNLLAVLLGLSLSVEQVHPDVETDTGR